MYVINFALKMEKVGKEYFEKLATQTSIRGVKAVFSMLADEQQELYDTFKAMKTTVGAPITVNSKALERARNSIKKIFDDKGVAIGLLKNDLDAYRHALQIELQMVKFLEEMAQEETDVEAKTLLKEILSEEKKHLDGLQNIHEFVAAPKTYLAGMEFSNLKDM